MTELPTWEVKLAVFGPIKTRSSYELSIFKAFRINDPFYSDINIRSSNFGVVATVTSFAKTSDLAHKAALSFFGQMLDTLALEIQQPLFLSFRETKPSHFEEHITKRIVEEKEWVTAFKEARCLNEYEPSFLRALGWYRKGLHTEDPFDKFLALWNSIEVTASKYHTPDERTKDGSKNQIWQCFKTVWGECDNWPFIKGNKDWIDENHNNRIGIAHGVKPVTVDSIEEIMRDLNLLEKVSHRFLTDWKTKKIPIDDHLSSLLAHIGVET